MPRRALVVDDESAIVFTLKTILESSGFLVDTASSAEGAKRSLGAAPYDIVITDLKMETATAGYEVAEAAAKQCPHPVVILVSAHHESMTGWQQHRVAAVFEKPTHTPDLLQAIEKLLNEQHGKHAV